MKTINARLLAAYGPVPPRYRLDPVSQLVRSLLSARTRDEVSKEAYEALLARFGSWEDVRNAWLPYIDRIIRKVTFPEKKGPWVQLALQDVTAQCGRLDLSFLSAMPVAEARSWLETLEGVGPKTSAAVVNFSTLRMRALPVDSHYFRVAKRLGLIPPKTTVETAHRLLMVRVPDDWSAEDIDDHFCLMKYHGQVCCRPVPRCNECPLLTLCPTGCRAAHHREDRADQASLFH